MMPATPATGRV